MLLVSLSYPRRVAEFPVKVHNQELLADSDNRHIGQIKSIEYIGEILLTFVNLEEKVETDTALSGEREHEFMCRIPQREVSQGGRGRRAGRFGWFGLRRDKGVPMNLRTVYSQSGPQGGRRAKAASVRARRRRLAATAEMLEARCLLAVTSTTPVPISVIEGSAFNGATMDFTANDAGPFTATINWGDATLPSAGVIAPAAGGFVVNGTHTYVEDGSYTATVTINDTADNTSVTPTTTATVREGSLSTTAHPSPSRRTARPPSSRDRQRPRQPRPGLGLHRDDRLGRRHRPRAGTVTAGTGGGSFDITGSHVYADEGTFTAITTFFENNDSGFTITSPARAPSPRPTSSRTARSRSPAGVRRGAGDPPTRRSRPSATPASRRTRQVTSPP